MHAWMLSRAFPCASSRARSRFPRLCLEHPGRRVSKGKQDAARSARPYAAHCSGRACALQGSSTSLGARTEITTRRAVRAVAPRHVDQTAEVTDPRLSPIPHAQYPVISMLWALVRECLFASDSYGAVCHVWLDPLGECTTIQESLYYPSVLECVGALFYSIVQ
jgi:hypothetical protein